MYLFQPTMHTGSLSESHTQTHTHTDTQTHTHRDHWESTRANTGRSTLSPLTNCLPVPVLRTALPYLFWALLYISHGVRGMREHVRAEVVPRSVVTARSACQQPCQSVSAHRQRRGSRGLPDTLYLLSASLSLLPTHRNQPWPQGKCVRLCVCVCWFVHVHSVASLQEKYTVLVWTNILDFNCRLYCTWDFNFVKRLLPEILSWEDTFTLVSLLPFLEMGGLCHALLKHISETYSNILN